MTKTIKIFVYEYLTGGGIDPALARAGSLADLSALIGEGRAMREALVDELRELDGVRVTYATSRFEAPGRSHGHCRPVDGESIQAFVARLAREHDYVWVIAPECDDLLLQLHDAVGDARWLGCSREAIRVASSKRASAACLAAHGIATTPALDPASVAPPGPGPWVVKPDDGAGSLDTFVFESYAAACAEYDSRAAAGRRSVLQEWVEGEPLSLSLICRDGGAEAGAELVSINRQQISIIERHAPGAHMGIVECDGVRIDQIGLGSMRGQTLASLARRVASALDGLRGFVGVDLVWHPARGPVVIEVNPRLTLAYAGLAATSGGRLTQAVLAAHGVTLAHHARRRSCGAQAECEARL
ncbi:ATP-grasp domain-containing protein [Trinickia sp. LjRoot230]|uniref:ATP-grasp domain-containing protein n=1 Tax=Trinickia sp. LjRoot230 TaxID=3342288 RepID=UPI003ED0212B